MNAEIICIIKFPGVSQKKKEGKRKTDSVYIVIQMFIHHTIKKKYKVYRQGILTFS